MSKITSVLAIALSGVALLLLHWGVTTKIGPALRLILIQDYGW